MEQPKRQARLTPEEQEEKVRLMRSGPPSVRKGSGKMPESFSALSRTREGRRALIKQSKLRQARGHQARSSYLRGVLEAAQAEGS